MDSISQFALGAAIGAAVLGRKVGVRAALIGGLVATLPDLDVLVPLGGPVANFTYHRSFSHSLLVLLAITPLLAWLIRRLQPQPAEQRTGWLWLVLLVLMTHPLLDAFTIYGTQLFWPLDTTPIGLGSIFIIDPLYSLPLLAGVIAFISLRRHPRRGLQLNAAGLLLSTLYLCWSAVAQQWVEQTVHRSLALEGRAHHQVLVQPTPLNTLLWRVLVMTDDGYREGFYSLLDQNDQITLQDYPSDHTLLNGLQQHWPVERLRGFTKGFYRVRQVDRAILITDLRIGIEPDYVFRFKVAEMAATDAKQAGAGAQPPRPTADQRVQSPLYFDRLPALWRRIWQQPTDPGQPAL